MTAPTEAPWGPGKPPFIIAEIGLTHEGSLGNALAFIDACADVGASAVKFQSHISDANKEFREGFEWPQDKTRQDYWMRTQFHDEHWSPLVAHALNLGILPGCTPFSENDVGYVQRWFPWLKIPRQHAGGSIHRRAIQTGKPVLHTGPGGLTLNDYQGGLGISDHSGTIQPALRAFTLGAQVAELHVCWDRRQFGPDVSMSVTIDELAELVRAVR